MKNRIKLIFILLLALLCLFLAGNLAWERLYPRFHPATYTPIPSPETNAPLENPFRGFFHLYGFTLSEEDPAEAARRAGQYVDSGSLPLMLVQINLKNYADTDLSDNALTQLDEILARLSSAGRQVILRFLYDWDGKALETEPKTIDRILRHMDQVGPVVNRYANAVFLLQGTFTGNCGEMTQTKFGSHEDNRTLMTRLAQVTDPSIFLAVRTPSHLRGVTMTRTPVLPENAFDGSLSSRLGLFNDGMLGSVYDLGTYDDTPNAGTSAPEDKGTREEELAFQETLCQYVPNGGEAVLDNPYSDFDRAVADLARMHVTYLNCDHDAAVMDKWKAAVYHGDDCFDGVSGYEYIAAHLGYRYVVTDSSLASDALAADSSLLSVTIENHGFAPCYRLLDASVTLEDTVTGGQVILPAELDNRIIGGGSQASFLLSLPIDRLPAGEYRIFLTLTDPYTGRAVRFANRETDSSGRVLLGNLAMEEPSPEKLLACLLERLRTK